MFIYIPRYIPWQKKKFFFKRDVRIDVSMTVEQEIRFRQT